MKLLVVKVADPFVTPLLAGTRNGAVPEIVTGPDVMSRLLAAHGPSPGVLVTVPIVRPELSETTYGFGFETVNVSPSTGLFGYRSASEAVLTLRVCAVTAVTVDDPVPVAVQKA